MPLAVDARRISPCGHLVSRLQIADEIHGDFQETGRSKNSTKD
jgi:hypothetical protein